MTMLEMVERKWRSAVIYAKPDYLLSELSVRDGVTMSDSFLALLVENLPQQRFAEAILRDKIESRRFAHSHS